jgi:hypothetical protein
MKPYHKPMLSAANDQGVLDPVAASAQDGVAPSP